MISRCNWFLAMLFLMTAFGCLIYPSSYIAIALKLSTGRLIAILFCFIVSILLPIFYKPKTHREIKNTAILTSLIIFCLIVPQVDTNMSKLFTSPMVYLEDSLK